MSNMYNDLVFDQLGELDGDLSDEQRVEVQKLIEGNDLEKALYISRWYANQNLKGEMRAIVKLNGKNRQGRPDVQPMDKDAG